MAIGATQKWYGGAALASVALLGAGWMVLITPQTANADQIKTQAQSVVSSNQRAQAQVAALKLEYQNLPALQSQLATIRTHIPATPDEPSLLRTLSTAASKSGVSLTSVAVTAPEIITAGATGAAGASKFATPGAMSQTSLTITVTGDFAHTRLFLNSIESMQRVMLVTALKITSATSDSGTALLSTAISARVFTASPGGSTPASTTTTTTGTTSGQPS